MKPLPRMLARTTGLTVVCALTYLAGRHLSSPKKPSVGSRVSPAVVPTNPSPASERSTVPSLAVLQRLVLTRPDEVMRWVFQEADPTTSLKLLAELGPRLATLDDAKILRALGSVRTKVELTAAWKAVIEARLVSDPAGAMRLAALAPPLSKAGEVFVKTHAAAFGIDSTLSLIMANELPSSWMRDNMELLQGMSREMAFAKLDNLLKGKWREEDLSAFLKASGNDRESRIAAMDLVARKFDRNFSRLKALSITMTEEQAADWISRFPEGYQRQRMLESMLVVHPEFQDSLAKDHGIVTESVSGQRNPITIGAFMTFARTGRDPVKSLEWAAQRSAPEDRELATKLILERTAQAQGPVAVLLAARQHDPALLDQAAAVAVAELKGRSLSADELTRLQDGLGDFFPTMIDKLTQPNGLEKPNPSTPQ